MSKERLSKLQKIILTVLKTKDRVEYEQWKKHKMNRQPPYWQKLRSTYDTHEEGGNSATGQLLESGVKSIVRVALKKLYGVDFWSKEENPRDDYFFKSKETGVKNRFGYEGHGPSSFDVSFSRSVRGLIEKGYIETTREGKGWYRVDKKQVTNIKLTEKGLNVNF